jgi:hypothetical protein
MIEATVPLLELHLDGPGLVSGTIARPPRLVLRPGQYLVGHAAGSDEPLATPLFVAQVNEESLRLAPGLPPAWRPGMELNVRGALGRGFHLPPAARRVALGAPEGHPFRLLPLLAAALAQGCEVALCAPRVPGGLPPQVEILEPQVLPELAAWADYLALDLIPGQIPALRTLLGIKHYQPLPDAGEALVFGPMPCAAAAECGACAVRTRQGWRLACKDGPVFNLRDLEVP